MLLEVLIAVILVIGVVLGILTSKIYVPDGFQGVLNYKLYHLSLIAIAHLVYDLQSPLVCHQNKQIILKLKIIFYKMRLKEKLGYGIEPSNIRQFSRYLNSKLVLDNDVEVRGGLFSVSFLLTDK
jgi:hypothetical protein